MGWSGGRHRCGALARVAPQDAWAPVAGVSSSGGSPALDEGPLETGCPSPPGTGHCSSASLELASLQKARE
ncbi:unnamed protein product [Rangifer tarandus platyrhynchus]|uniref:Uncharacterized protein n=1 Tax=Rangifer tarandus platyrhynchus TaxID=3082113 RepID=A0ABN8YCE0_RANTA|nr:unnamed protein product [Rangifer tarandus platyrhynchus]